MKLTELHQHFNNEEVFHAYTMDDLIHVVYKNVKNERTFTLPKDEEIEPELAMLACTALDIPVPFELEKEFLNLQSTSGMLNNITSSKELE